MYVDGEIGPVQKDDATRQHVSVGLLLPPFVDPAGLFTFQLLLIVAFLVGPTSGPSPREEPQHVADYFMLEAAAADSAELRK